MKILKLIVVFLIFPTGILAQNPSNTFEIKKNLELMQQVYENLDMYYVDDMKPGQLMKKGIDAMLKELDPYTVFIPESRIEDLRFMTTGQYGGIGAVIRQKDKGVAIVEPYEGFPAQTVGIEAGDYILEVDGKSTSDLTSTQVSDMLRGQSDTEVKLLLERNGEKITKKFKRQEVKIDDVPYFGMINDKVGYIKLTGFTQTASKEVAQAYVDLKGKGMEQLVFDLRGNGGGLLIEAVRIVNFFVSKGELIVYTKGKLPGQNVEYFATSKPLDKDIPIAVLVDGGSASASEIVSGGLQDLDRAVIVGQTSFGKGLVQQPRDLKYNAKIKLTIAKYYTPSGRCIQKLNYFNRADGKRPEEVPDSLLNKFKTKNGRSVIDGRGVEPEIKIDQKEYSRLTATLMGNDFIFDFATEFKIKNKKISAARDFKIDDQIFTEFKTFLSDKEYDYTTASQEILKELKAVVEREKYMEDAQSEYDDLLAKLTPSKDKDLDRYRKEISFFLANEIVSRYYYQDGRIDVTLNEDPFILEAVKVLSNKDQYNKLLDGDVK